MTSKRDMAAANETGFLQPHLGIIYYVRMDFSSGVQRFHSRIGPKTATHPIHGSEVYTGVGDFGGIEGDVVESIASLPQALAVSITGVKSAFNNIIITDNYFRRDVDIMVGLFNPSTGVLLADPEILYSGFMDKADLVLTEKAGRISLSCESRATILQRASDWRFTDEDLQIEYPGDLMGEYIYKMLDLKIYWGDKEVGGWGTGGPSPESERDPGQGNEYRP